MHIQNEIKIEEIIIKSRDFTSEWKNKQASVSSDANENISSKDYEVQIEQILNNEVVMNRQLKLALTLPGEVFLSQFLVSLFSTQATTILSHRRPSLDLDASTSDTKFKKKGEKESNQDRMPTLATVVFNDHSQTNSFSSNDGNEYLEQIDKVEKPSEQSPPQFEEGPFNENQASKQTSDENTRPEENTMTKEDTVQKTDVKFILKRGSFFLIL
ncbi:hypothetical protein RFI_19452 [Reticulomyxa filosa]|uniref:Uncharacterized protein n=1 Tax=Reticulomyxa filosa TaxID=46433 RepID=X6MWJ7_RETFI|nr:hypothetical protein RFI_19452 [Reticulomyxa filosa]|eukprot:ETO17857.1 hypothetical protein RFI_19452 [Reticulomyxa filosa]